MAHSLTNSIQSFSHFGCFIPHFFMSMPIKRQRRDKTSTTRRVFPTKGQYRAAAFLEQKQACWYPPEFLNPLTANARLKKRATEAPTESTERLKGRCFIPRGISSYSLLQSADRSFIELSAHLQQQIGLAPSVRSTVAARGKQTGSRNSALTNVLQKMCIIYCHDITHEFLCSGSSEGWVCVLWNYSFPKEQQTAKSLRVEDNSSVFCLPLKGFGGIRKSCHPSGNTNSIVKFR